MIRLLAGLLLLLPIGASSPTTLIEGVYRDSALEVSPDGRFVLVSVRDRDTTGDGRINDRDGKSLLLLENGREAHRFGTGQFSWQDKMARWSEDGRQLAVVLPRPGAVLAATELILFDPVARRETARFAGGINPFWLWDGRLGYQLENEIRVVTGERVERVVPAATLGPAGGLVREIAVDAPARRIVVSLAGHTDIRMRVGAGRRGTRAGHFVELRETSKGWEARALPWRGFTPKPTADGLYYYEPRGDVSGNGRYEIALDGVNLMCEGRLIAEDATLYALFDHATGRFALLRRDETFHFVQLNADGSVRRTIRDALARNSSTWVTTRGGRSLLVAETPEDGGNGAGLYEVTRHGPLMRIADGPVARAVIGGSDAYAVIARDKAPGRLVRVNLD